MLGQVVVVEPPIAVRQHSAHVAVERTQQAAIVLALQPGVDVAVEQLGLVLAHFLEVGIRDAQLVGELAARQGRDAVAGGAAGFLDH